METGAGKTALGLQRGGQHRRPPVSIAELERAIVREALRDGRIKAAARIVAARFVISSVEQHEGVSWARMRNNDPKDRKATATRRLVYLILRRMEPLGYYDSDIAKLFMQTSSSNVLAGSKSAQRRLLQEPDTLAWARSLYLRAAAVAGISVENHPLIHSGPKPRKRQVAAPVRWTNDDS